MRLLPGQSWRANGPSGAAGGISGSGNGGKSEPIAGGGGKFRSGNGAGISALVCFFFLPLLRPKVLTYDMSWKFNP